MAKVSFTNLKLKTDKSVHTIDFNGTSIEILNYLPIEDVNELVAATLAKSKEGNIYNPLKQNMYRQLHMVYMYTNLNFTDKQREDEPALYDTLESSGLMGVIIGAIDKMQVAQIADYIDCSIARHEENDNKVGAVIKEFINKLPANAENAAEIVKSFNPEQFQEVIQFARAANGGRAIEELN